MSKPFCHVNANTVALFWVDVLNPLLVASVFMLFDHAVFKATFDASRVAVSFRIHEAVFLHEAPTGKQEGFMRGAGILLLKQVW